MPGLRDLAALPKAELHIHLEGAMRPQTLTELCEKHGVERPADTAGQRFPDFGPFASTYIACCQCLREQADLDRLVREVAEDAKASGAVWIEPALSFVFYADFFGGKRPTLLALMHAAERAEDATGVQMGFIVSVERHMPVDDAVELAKLVRSLVDGREARINGKPGIIGFGLHGPEVGFPPEPFEEAFRLACCDVVQPMPHAGELEPSPGDGAESVRCCIRQLGARRIAHGTFAAKDDELIAELAREGVCLDMCPTSNYLLRAVENLSELPLPKFMAAGVACTINSDDPLLFGPSLLQEYEACRRDLGMSDEALAACARNSFQHSRAPEALKVRGVRGVERWLHGEASSAVEVALKKHHAVLGLVYFEEDGSFSLFERLLFLCMAIGTAWLGVYLKYFYLRVWVPILFDEIEEELHLFPNDWLSDIIDSAGCSGMGAIVDVFMGKEQVRNVLKTDWEHADGWKSTANSLVTGYALLLSAFSLSHFVLFVVTSKPAMVTKLLGKFFGTLVLKLVVVETALCAVKVFAGKAPAGDKKRE